MSNQHRGILSLCAAVIFVSILYYTEALSRASEYYQDTPQNHPVPTPNVLPSTPPLSNAAVPGGAQKAIVLADNNHGLKELCANTKWTEGLWLHCHSYCGDHKQSACGGLNNARNRIQTCLRMAIDAGASIIIPSTTTRDANSLVDTNAATVCADRFWDMEYLQASMQDLCPQMQMKMCDDRTGIKNEILTGERGYLGPSFSNGTFGAAIQRAFAESDSGLKFENVSASNSAVVNFGDSYIGWNYRASKELMTIRKGLFKVLRFNQELFAIGNQISKSPELKDGYIGVHLRGESDWPDSFGSADQQMEKYALEIQKIQSQLSYPLNTIYVSCGDQEAISRFRTLLTKQNPSIIVHDKHSLLATQPDILAQINGYGFDQKGVIEYQTLVGSRFWMGVIMSSMSSLIAYARHVNDEVDVFEKYVFPGSERGGLERFYKESEMRGNRRTKLMVVNGVDIMDSFP